MPREVVGKGKWGEDRAVEFLRRQEFEILERNFNSSVGEIDIVARKGGDLYFIEVKTRLVGPFAYDISVTNDKKHKMKKTVARYCLKRGIKNYGLVFSSLMVVVDKAAKKVSFRMSVLY